MYDTPLQAAIMNWLNKHGSEEHMVEIVQSVHARQELVEDSYDDFYDNMPELTPWEEWAHKLFGMPELEKQAPALGATDRSSLSKDLLFLLSLCSKYDVPNLVCLELCETLLCVYVAMANEEFT
ncbi:hypothetical protein M758_UG211900 [Ceratodon purpureus]|nr:hypothetical protein M758_UG211900 [Ceratodon purpureus]